MNLLFTFTNFQPKLKEKYYIKFKLHLYILEILKGILVYMMTKFNHFLLYEYLSVSASARNHQDIFLLCQNNLNLNLLPAGM